MRNFIILLIFFFSFVILSCSENNDNSNAVDVTNVMTIDEDQFTIESAVYEKFDVENGIYNFGLIFLSEGIGYNESEERIIGTGSLILIDLYTSNESELAPGTYRFIDTYESNPFTCTFASAVKNIDTETLEEDQIENQIDAVSGVVRVIGTGNNQVVEVELIDINGKELSANYKGIKQLVVISD